MRQILVRSGENGEAEGDSGSSPRLYQRAFDILAAQIEDGSLPVDTGLTETAVASRFGISRAPARRALADLEKAGFVTRTENRGLVVSAGPYRRAASSRPEGSGKLSGTDAEKLVSLPSWERIHGEVEAEIIARISFASWRVNEAELARHYRVSRTVARDVIARLQQGGLVQKDDSSRWYAPALTADHVGELYELRWMLEPVALTKAAPKLPVDLLLRMRAELERSLADTATVEGEVLDALEHDLHVVLLGHCGNRALMQAITYPQSLLIAHRFLYRWTSRLFAQEPFLPEHLDIVEMLQKGRTEDAADRLEAHLRVSRDRAIARIDVIAAGSQPDTLSYLERLPTTR